MTRKLMDTKCALKPTCCHIHLNIPCLQRRISWKVRRLSSRRCTLSMCVYLGPLTIYGNWAVCLWMEGCRKTVVQHENNDCAYCVCRWLHLDCRYNRWSVVSGKRHVCISLAPHKSSFLHFALSIARPTLWTLTKVYRIQRRSGA